MRKIKCLVYLIFLCSFNKTFANQVNEYTNIYNRSIKANCLKIFKNQPNVCSCVKERWIAHLKVKNNDRYNFSMLARSYQNVAADGGPKKDITKICSNPNVRIEKYRWCLNQSLELEGKIIISEPFTVDGKTYGVDQPAPIRAYFKHKWGPGFEERWLLYTEKLKVTSFDDRIQFDCQALEGSKKASSASKGENVQRTQENDSRINRNRSER